MSLNNTPCLEPFKSELPRYEVLSESTFGGYGKMDAFRQVNGSHNSSLNGFINATTTNYTETLPVKVIKLICYTLVFVIGVFGNALVFRMVLRRRKLQTVSNYLICNLAAADIAVLTVNLPFRLAYQENSYVWPFGSFLCKIIPMLTYLFITASSATLVVMSLDQHRAVLHPLKKRLTITQTKIVMVLVWFISALITLPLNFSLRVIYRQGNAVCTDMWPSLKFEQIYFVLLFILQFLLPMSVITTFYTHVCLKLNSNNTEDALLQSHLVQRERRNKKVIKMLIVIVAVNALCTLPYHVTWLVSVFGYPNSLAKKFCVLLVIATSAAHPIIYGTLNQDFARGFRSYLKCMREHSQAYRETVRKISGTTRQNSVILPCKNSVSNSTPLSSHALDKNKERVLTTTAGRLDAETIVVQEFETCL